MTHTRTALVWMLTLLGMGLGMGSATTGCSGRSASDATTDERKTSIAAADTATGSICAAGATGATFCAPAAQDPAALWKQALPGGLPIQMWATWPANVTLDQLVSSAAALNAWLADVDKALAYVRDVQQNAESYRASMAGNLSALMKQAMADQARLMAVPPTDPIGDLKAALNAKTAAEKSPLLAQLTSDKQSVASVSAVLAAATAKIAPIQQQFAAISTSFQNYHATEAAETAAYATLGTQASATTLTTISTVEQSIVNQARASSTTPNDIELSIMQTEGLIQEFELQFHASIAPYTSFMATHGANVPDMTSGALRSLSAMLGYIQARQSRSDAAAGELLAGIEVRRQALVTLATAAATRETLAQTQLLAASSTFTNDATARIGALWATPPMSTTLKLPYLSGRVDRFTSFLQLQPLCAPTSSSWRETGCISLRTNFNTAKSYLATTIPLLIKVGVSKMQTAKVDPALLAAVTAKLTAGDIKGAAVAYDAAVQSSEAQ